MATNTAPILNDYKIAFARRRVAEVVLGGVTLFFNEDTTVPFYVYLLQFVIAIIPVVIGLILQLVYDKNQSFTHDWIPALIFAGVMGLITILAKSASALTQRRETHARAKNAESASLAYAHLGEEEEYHFDRLVGVLSFLFPVSSHKFWILPVLAQGIVTGCVCFGGFYFMLPSNIKDSYPEMPVLLFQILGWICFVLCQYSLTARPPPEPNQFRSHDALGLGRYTRPFYVLICFVINLVFKWVPDSDTIEALVYVNKAFHIVFLVLPLLFIFGFLPQIEVVIAWGIEQTHIFFLGGSALASDFRLYWLAVIGGASVAIVYSVYSVYDFVSVGLGAGLGFLLSSDIVSFTKKSVKTTAITPIQVPEMSVPRYRSQALRHRPFPIILCSVIVGVGSGLLSAYDNNITNHHDTLVRRILDSIILSTLVIYFIFSRIQRPYLFSITRQRYNKAPRLFSILVFITSKLACIAMTVLLSLYALENSNSRIFLPRAFRWIWQSTPAALLEMTIVEWCVVFAFDNRGWDLPLLLFYAAMVDDRLFQFCNKMFYVVRSLISVLQHKKLRFTHYRIVIALQIVFFPVLIGIVAVSCVFSAPILPLLGIPIFIIGYPRPARVWQTSGKNYQKAEDTIYYRQLVPRLVGELADSFGKGVLGWGKVGSMYLLRLESKFIWIHVIERGNSYMSILVKGLELQETSCHHAEAAKVDEIVDRTLEDPNAIPFFNEYCMHTLEPVGKLSVLTYANNNMILTGIIDHPDNLKVIPEFFLKALVFVLKKWKTNEKMSSRQPHISKYSHLSREAAHRFPHEFMSLLNTRDNMSPRPRLKSPRAKSRPSSPSPSRPSSPSPASSISHSIAPSSPSPAPAPWTTSPPQSSGTTPLLTSNVVSPPPSSLSSSSHVHHPQAWMGPEKSPLPPLSSSSPSLEDEDPVDDFLSEWNAIKKTSNWKGNEGEKQVGSENDNMKQKDSNESMEKYKNEKTGKENKLSSSSNNETRFSTELKPIRKNTLEPIVERVPRDPFIDLVSICYSLIEVGGYHDPFSGPRHVYEVYTGVIPSSVEAAFLDNDKDLREMVLRAYKYAFKLAFDQSVIGEYENDTEILALLEEYSKLWYFGQDTSEEWKENMQGEIENLFSMSMNEGIYSAHILSLRKLAVSVATINEEGVRALWSSLNQELLFFTNDDEERYSIQAHADLLRNVTVQAAEPPLGYPVFGQLYDIPL